MNMSIMNIIFLLQILFLRIIFNHLKIQKWFLAFRPYQHNLGVEFGPWDVRCNGGLFYPFTVDSATQKDHHSQTEWHCYVLWLWNLYSKNKTKLPKAAWGVRGSSRPAPRVLPHPPPPTDGWPPCYCQNLAFLWPPMPNLKIWRWNFGGSRRLYSSAGQGEHTTA